MMFGVIAGMVCCAVVCDADSDCFYVPPRAERSGLPVAALVLLHCNGAGPADIDSFRFLADSLGWALASCHRSRNHRSPDSNHFDIVRTAGKLRGRCRVDTGRVFLFGFSGQGVQALQTMFLRPDLIRGVIAVCPHDAAMGLADWSRLTGHAVYLVTRTQDWNRLACERMCRAFSENGVRCRLTTTPGEHSPGSRFEVFAGCCWLETALGN